MSRHASRAARIAAPAMAALLVLVAGGCATVTRSAEAIDGKPLDAFVDELKADLQEVHWRLRGGASCSGDPERVIDLRNARVTLILRRVAEANLDGEVKLVAEPLFGGAGTVALKAEGSRKSVRNLTVRLDVDGPSPVYTPGSAPEARSALARTLNAAIDAFMRSSASQPCVHLAGLAFEFVLDVERGASGAFRIVVPPVSLGGGAAREDLNTLTISWDKVQSNALR